LAYAQSGNSAEAVKHLKAYLKAAPKANDKAMVEKRIDQLQHK
jgi:regulator of sirC expression with transglutaminase-like and TPR domain